MKEQMALYKYMLGWEQYILEGEKTKQKKG